MLNTYAKGCLGACVVFSLPNFLAHYNTLWPEALYRKCRQEEKLSGHWLRPLLVFF